MIRSPISISGPHQFQGGTGLFSAGRIPPRWSRTERYCGWSGGYRSSASSTIPTGLTARSCRTMVSSGSIVAANARLPLLGSHDVIRSRGRDRGCEKAREDTNADGAGEESAKNHALQTSSCTGVQQRSGASRTPSAPSLLERRGFGGCPRGGRDGAGQPPFTSIARIGSRWSSASFLSSSSVRSCTG